MIPKTVLVLAEGFGGSLGADRVATAIGRGLEADGRLQCDLCELVERPGRGPGKASAPGGPSRSSEAARSLDEHDFDRRMRAARAVVIVREQLDDRTLIGSVAFEAATRARQTGVPAYAVTAHDELDPFEARIVDLQVIVEASCTPRSLSAAARKLAALV